MQCNPIPAYSEVSPIEFKGAYSISSWTRRLQSNCFKIWGRELNINKHIERSNSASKWLMGTVN